MNSTLITFSLCLLLGSVNTLAQTPVDAILDSISKNNKAILAYKQYWEAKKLEFKTGLTPYNPFVEYEYLKGTPVGAGNQTDFAVTQSFDFPTSYIKRKQVSDERILQTEFQQTAVRQGILLQGKLNLLELIYLNKKQDLLSKRVGNLDEIHSSYQRKFEVGEANILDLNKIKIQVINLRNEVARIQSEKKQYKEKLVALNGGISIIISDSIYPLVQEVPEYSTMDSLVEANDPILKLAKQEKEISAKEVQLMRALALPKMEAGYHYQSILGQRYQGVHVGLTIPLWENANKVKQFKAEEFHDELQIERHRNEHLYEIKELYLKYENLKATLEEYQSLLKEVNTESLLDKALQLGEISTIEYFMELSFLYESQDKYLQLEKEYHQVVAELFKYQL